jgi:PUA domain protein
MENVKRRFFLKEKDAKNLLKETSKIFGDALFEVKPKIEVAEIPRGEIFIVNGRPVLIRYEGGLVPALTFEDLISNLPKVIVDMGAIPHICNGADIMAPGIVGIEGKFKEGSLAAVLDEKHKKTIAVAKALVSSEEIRGLKHGKALKNLHYVGDSFWEVIKIFQRRSS